MQTQALLNSNAEDAKRLDLIRAKVKRRFQHNKRKSRQFKAYLV